MSTSSKNVNKIISDFEENKTIEAYYAQLRPKTAEELAQLENVSLNTANDQEGKQARLQMLQESGANVDVLSGRKPIDSENCFAGNVENFIGMTQVPVGLAGPLLINGTHAEGDFFIPLATTEGALVASYSRGMKACRLSGGITAVSLSEGVQRSPFFKFKDVVTVALFVKWVHIHLGELKEMVKEKSNYAVLNELRTNVEGNSAILTFEFSTGDAAGQNMVTICTDYICRHILENCPIKPLEWYIESNYSGDKKATSLAFTHVRGKKVTTEIVLKKEIVEKVLKTTPDRISKYWQASTLAVVQSGSIGAQGHIANGLTALFIACGQDVACIAETSIGLTRMQITDEGDLYVSLTMPGLIIGTIGGGTNLPTQAECLELLGCRGPGKAKKFAEICCATALAGEISIAAAMSIDHFTRAHENLGRKK